MTSGSPEHESSPSSGDPVGRGDDDVALVVLRVWWEEHDDTMRGRLVAPYVEGPRSGYGQAQLVSLVVSALRALAARHGRRRSGDGPVTLG